MAEELFDITGIEVIDNSIPYCSAKRNAPESFTRFLFVGRLSPEKNIDETIKAFVHVQNSVLDILGDGPQKQELENMADNLGISDKVNFHGWVSKEEVSEWMLKSHCLILHSRAEGMPMSGLTAFSRGLPVIGSDATGMKNFIVDGETGFIVELENKDKLVDLMNKIAGKEIDLETMSNNCRKAVKEKYNVDRAADEYLELIQSMIGR